MNIMKSKLIKRIIGITLCMAMVFSMGAVSAADVEINVNDLITEQALAQYDTTNTNEFSLVAMQG